MFWGDDDTCGEGGELGEIHDLQQTCDGGADHQEDSDATLHGVLGDVDDGALSGSTPPLWASGPMELRSLRGVAAGRGGRDGFSFGHSSSGHEERCPAAPLESEEATRVRRNVARLKKKMIAVNDVVSLLSRTQDENKVLKAELKSTRTKCSCQRAHIASLRDELAAARRNASRVSEGLTERSELLSANSNDTATKTSAGNFLVDGMSTEDNQNDCGVSPPQEPAPLMDTAKDTIDSQGLVSSITTVKGTDPSRTTVQGAKVARGRPGVVEGVANGITVEGQSSCGGVEAEASEDPVGSDRGIHGGDPQPMAIGSGRGGLAADGAEVCGEVVERNDEVSRIRGLLGKRDEVITELMDKLSELQAREERIIAEKSQLEATAASQTKLVANLRKQVDDMIRERTALQAESAAAKAENDSYKAQFSHIVAVANEAAAAAHIASESEKRTLAKLCEYQKMLDDDSGEAVPSNGSPPLNAATTRDARGGPFVAFSRLADREKMMKKRSVAKSVPGGGVSLSVCESCRAYRATTNDGPRRDSNNGGADTTAGSRQAVIGSETEDRNSDNCDDDNQDEDDEDEDDDDDEMFLYDIEREVEASTVGKGERGSGTFENQTKEVVVGRGNDVTSSQASQPQSPRRSPRRLSRLNPRDEGTSGANNYERRRHASTDDGSTGNGQRKAVANVASRISKAKDVSMLAEHLLQALQSRPPRLEPMSWSCSFGSCKNDDGGEAVSEGKREDYRGASPAPVTSIDNVMASCSVVVNTPGYARIDDKESREGDGSEVCVSDSPPRSPDLPLGHDHGDGSEEGNILGGGERPVVEQTDNPSNFRSGGAMRPLRSHKATLKRTRDRGADAQEGRISAKAIKPGGREWTSTAP